MNYLNTVSKTPTRRVAMIVRYVVVKIHYAIVEAFVN